jgi:hypothetical protein
VFVVCIFVIGRIHSSMLRDEVTEAGAAANWAKEPSSA